MTSNEPMPYLLSTYRSDDRVVIQCESVEKAEEALARVMAWLLSLHETAESADPARKKMRQFAKRFDVSEGSNGRIYIDDDDFHWDGALYVSGDFESDAEKRRYAQAIADVLSAHESDIPHRPAEETK